MKKDIKSDTLNEHLEKIKHRFDYQINESSYRQIVDKNEEYDEVPVMEADDENVENSPEGEVVDAPVPEFDKTGGDVGDIPSGEEQVNVDTEVDVVDQNPSTEEQIVDEIQNDIIKHNINAMRNIHNELTALNGIVDKLNSKVDTLNADVEEVREPSNTEKLMKQSDVSYPYYHNLNDLWSDNWFEEKRSELDEKGIRELPDGTYIADFDDLPQQSNMEIKKSFDSIV